MPIYRDYLSCGISMSGQPSDVTPVDADKARRVVASIALSLEPDDAVQATAHVLAALALNTVTEPGKGSTKRR